jgi:protein TonB
MSLTYSTNQSRQTGSRTAVIIFIVMLHAAVLIAFNNGIGKILKSTPFADLTVVEVPPDPPAEKAAPVPEVPSSIPEAVLSPPLINPDIQLDVTPPVSDAPPAEASATATSDVPTVDKLSLSSRVDPIYPASAQRAGYEGTVLLEITVDTNGRAMEVHVTRSSGYDVLDAAAIQAVKQWRFNHPATIVKVHVPITFKLKQRTN